MDSAAVERFEAGRGRLASLAYRLLGSAADAEDVVQDTFLRWQAADRERIEVPEAWLTKVVTHLCLDRLRSAQARHERAAGAWLPEPLLEGDPMLGPADTVEQRESVSLAVLTLMERLSPVERAVYVLREAFSYSHAEIARILDVTESASQQHAHRARVRVAAERRRGSEEVDLASARRVVEEFLAAATSGRTERLVALLTDDVTAVSDGAGRAKRLLRLTTRERVASYVRAGFRPTPVKRRLAGGSPVFHIAVLNGSPAVLAVVDDRVVGTVVFDVRDGRVASLCGIAAADRLARLDEAWRQHGSDAPVVAAW
ncbi:sigma-70 family RNA polymerase sigma factor [Streptomyces coelicolor]|uniref:Sigma-70 family RNA polymerase sigma factor n=1 Tax=Streptomyces griseoincarnatus TaxID=29305 RepID=A0ABT0VKL4_STRGI|nr:MULTISPECIES: sigma-70 family RNA polymerase sigma factor [Streptomyces]MBJ6614266.1 sigma-70 family RNA polymerase sigma factor [Streptomyces sp. I3(2020)]NUV52540.1 sigma-70 family RNA polymerase sigma factor [Streptomyces coelicolor]MBJ6624503.1 sigma-70 family RNA polymerase sigma factor [Streptomyces sp. I4(2020)]MCM2511891.1 sigma-70 family RNA polymerase sigma factor [Streptomyces griseoincarnatus]RMI91648.1 RNA polymerase subunit sigma-70 [Streptomyces sp. ZS0098]